MGAATRLGMKGAAAGMPSAPPMQQGGHGWLCILQHGLLYMALWIAHRRWLHCAPLLARPSRGVRTTRVGTCQRTHAQTRRVTAGTQAVCLRSCCHFIAQFRA